ncbi:hypothetical protein JCM9140_2693 [Halalkalibacter wakoensis JCM 9140]|uniref:Uncharacterized protein n=1 Tax=Halalkalibacter wakoensis JCM 9140 TaxID=1236970 RepID=W4Q5H2_9BACI|nr:hypothetical protein JCM9140_2693 [Halalkalibacter wakoensis JCM 9140]
MNIVININSKTAIKDCCFFLMFSQEFRDINKKVKTKALSRMRFHDILNVLKGF